MTAPTDLIAASADRFRHDTTGHRMTVLRDDGLYRHVRFDNGRNEICRFDIVTWPGGLAFAGDGMAYVFRSLADMFEFFRHNGNQYGINPSYWSEKLVGGSEAAESYSEERFEEHVAEALAKAEAKYPGVTAAWAEHMEWNACADFEDQARDALRDFEFTPDGAAAGSEPFRFQDIWELDFTDWDRWYLWACHAIVRGIGQYDAARSAIKAAGVPV